METTSHVVKLPQGYSSSLPNDAMRRRFHKGDELSNLRPTKNKKYFSGYFFKYGK